MRRTKTQLLAGIIALGIGAFPITGTMAQTTGNQLAPADENFSDGATVERSYPLEFINRPIAAINRLLRQGVIDPVAKVYKFVTPDVAEIALSNAARNLTEPFSVLGAVIAGDTEGAKLSGARFLVNTTLGVAGLADVATEAGLEYCREDIGQGLAKQGVEPGTHIVLPIIGPTNSRDLPGDIVEVLITPLPPGVTIAMASVEYADNQESVENLTKGSVDKYVTEREAYEQHRLYQVELTCKAPEEGIGEKPKSAKSE
ncbi:MAG: VacJ family lipoprotein [Proteobacteria bacterium]|nr:VacJ family lipoprotein [Pseudomonadota bacterium]